MAGFLVIVLIGFGIAWFVLVAALGKKMSLRDGALYCLARRCQAENFSFRWSKS
jgi:hypothetical protein